MYRFHTNRIVWEHGRAYYNLYSSLYKEGSDKQNLESIMGENGKIMASFEKTGIKLEHVQVPNSSPDL